MDLIQRSWKTPSGLRPDLLDRSPTFLVNRSLGRYRLPNRLREVGLAVVLLADLWPGDEQELSDEVWLRKVAAEGWVALSSDDGLLRDFGEERVADCGARVFHLKASLSARDQSALVVSHLASIVACCERNPAPFIARVRQDDVRLSWPR